MKLLVFSDLHNDFRTASKLVELSDTVDVVVGAGDFCVARQGLDEIIAPLSAITKPTVLVPGNSESNEELLQACRSWEKCPRAARQSGNHRGDLLFRHRRRYTHHTLRIMEL